MPFIFFTITASISKIVNIINFSTAKRPILKVNLKPVCVGLSIRPVRLCDSVYLSVRLSVYPQCTLAPYVVELSNLADNSRWEEIGKFLWVNRSPVSYRTNLFVFHSISWAEIRALGKRKPRQGSCNPNSNPNVTLLLSVLVYSIFLFFLFFFFFMGFVPAIELK